MNVLTPEFLFSVIVTPTSATITDTNELKTFAALEDCLGHRVWILRTWSWRVVTPNVMKCLEKHKMVSW